MMICIVVFRQCLLQLSSAFIEIKEKTKSKIWLTMIIGFFLYQIKSTLGRFAKTSALKEIVLVFTYLQHTIPLAYSWKKVFKA